MKTSKALEELSASISLIITDTSDIIWKQNLSGELNEYDKNKLTVFFGLSSDVMRIQRMLHDMTQEILSSKRTFDDTRHQKLSKMIEPYDNFFDKTKDTIILLHGAAHFSYCVCKRIMYEFDNDDPYDKEVHIFLDSLKNLLYLLGRVVNNFRVYGEPKYLY
jgi:cob(I)alamin adenosyltransferase